MERRWCQQQCWEKDLVGGMVQLNILKLQEYVSREKDTEELPQAANNPIQQCAPGILNSVYLKMMLDAACRHRRIIGLGFEVKDCKEQIALSAAKHHKLASTPEPFPPQRHLNFSFLFAN